MNSKSDILERITADIEHSVIMEHTSSVTMMEEIKREITSLRQFKRDVKGQLDMAMFAYSKNDDYYVKGIIEELIKLESKEL